MGNGESNHITVVIDSHRLRVVAAGQSSKIYDVTVKPDNRVREFDRIVSKSGVACDVSVRINRLGHGKVSGGRKRPEVVQTDTLSPEKGMCIVVSVPRVTGHCTAVVQGLTLAYCPPRKRS